MKKFYILSLLLVFATLYKAQSTFTYTGKPIFQMDVKRGGNLLGSVKLELFPTVAPLHVINFDSLVSVQFFDSTAFHRVIPNFMIQGGDPNSRHGNPSTWGQGQPTQPSVNAEFTAARHIRGTLSAARDTTINSANSQFFICVVPYPSLNGQYSAYGRVISGMNWVDTIVNAPRNLNDRPYVKHEMFITRLGSNDSVPAKPNPNTPPNNTGTINVQAQQMFKWNNVPGAVIYTLQVAEDSLFNNLVKTVKIGGNTTYISNTFTQDSIYYWRVMATNGGNYSPWSKVFNFGKKAYVPPVDTTNTDTTTTGLLNLQMSQRTMIFPNPNHGKFTISNLETDSKVEIYDLAGRLVEEVSVTSSKLIIDLSGRAKGLYTYKIHSRDKGVLEGKIIVE